jgi:hypothetical protein
MFKKKLKPADPADRRADLAARLTAAEDRLTKLRADAVSAASTNPDQLAALSEQAARAEFEADVLSHAIDQTEQVIEEAADLARQEADRAQRETTAAALNAMADRRTEIGDILGAGGTMLPFLVNLREQLPASAMFHVEELRTRAQAVLDGNAPPCLPAKPDLAIIENGQPLMEKSPWYERGRPSGPVRLPERMNPDLRPAPAFQEYHRDPPITHVSFPKGAEPELGSDEEW